MQNQVRVCVDGKKDGSLFGKVAGNGIKPQEFHDITGLTRRIETVFDQLNYPEKATEYRVFKRTAGQPAGSGANGAREKMAKEVEKDTQVKSSGKKATFVVQVFYRQNATWQGQVVWSEKNQTKQFRSALELIKLIDSAVEESEV